jgi:hypothetical protein
MDKSRNPCIGSQAKQHEHTGCAMKYPEACAISDCLCLPSDVPQSVCQSIYLSAYLNTLFLPVSVCIAASVCACLFDCNPVGAQHATQLAHTHVWHGTAQLAHSTDCTPTRTHGMHNPHAHTECTTHTHAWHDTHIRTHARTCVHVWMRACVRACVRPARACVHARMRACVRTCVHACVRACMRAYMHSCVYACVRASVRVTRGGLWWCRLDAYRFGKDRME